MQGTPPPSPFSAGQTDDGIGLRRLNRPAAWAALLGLAANAVGLVCVCSGGLTLGREERLVPAAPIAPLILTFLCLVVSIAAIRLGRSGLGLAKLPATAGRGRATAGIVLGGFGIAWTLIMFIQTRELAFIVKGGSAPKSVSRVRCAERLRAIGNACAQYASKNDGRYPDEFIKLHTECGLDTNTLFCGRRTWSRTPTIQEVVDVTEGGLVDSFVYAGAGLSTGVAPDTVLVYERLTNHEWGIHILYADGRVEWLKEERAKELIAAMQPKPPASGPAAAATSRPVLRAP